LAKSPAPLGADPQDTVSLAALLGQLEEGAFDRDASAALRGLVARLINLYRKDGGRPKGSLSVVIEFVLIDGLVQTAQSFAVKPDLQRAVDRFYPSLDGGLTQTAPTTQSDLPLPAKKGARL
jgi:hypothetical protein